jgi:gas vesicle protein
VSDWAVFWSGVGGVLAGTVVGAVTSFLIARSTLLRTRADDKELAREERNEDAARRSTEALIDLQEALKWDRTEQVGPLDWLATVSQAVESLVRVTKLDIPILGSREEKRTGNARLDASHSRALRTWSYYRR